MKTISIIGAGAAGLMTAATILESDQENIHIHLFDKNPLPGRKVALAGGGRCNLTTGIDDKKILLSKYTRGSEFIKKALGKFSPRKCREWFESRGLPLKTEEDNRVFPLSDEGLDVVEVFENIFAKHRDRITLHYGESVSVIARNEAIQRQDGEFLITTSKGAYKSDFLVITTGGNAYAHTGSSGDGYAFARSLGHTITQLGPSLSSFITEGDWIHELSGLRLENAKIGAREGSLLFTHFGISGPLTFMLSSDLAWEVVGSIPPSEGGIKGGFVSKKVIKLIPLAQMDFSAWNTFLKEQFQSHPKKIIANILSEKLPRRFVDGFVNEFLSGTLHTFVSSLSRESREQIARLLGEGIPLTLIERRAGDEFVTAGGVDTSEINPETMESRIQKNLYFAGEVLNVDAVTGGFNLHACWAGGYVVGRSVTDRLLK